MYKQIRSIALTNPNRPKQHNGPIKNEAGTKRGKMRACKSTIGLGFAHRLNWLRKWCEPCQPITERSFGPRDQYRFPDIKVMNYINKQTND